MKTIPTTRHRRPRPGDEPADVVVVGARPAGAGTALLLARRGHRVVVLDRTAHGSDTLSSHALMRGAVHQLSRWGLLDRVVDAGTPPLPRVTFDYAGERTQIDLAEPLYAPRRTVLDPIIADAAVEAGARVHHGVDVEGLLSDSDGTVRGVRGRAVDGEPFELRARIVVGADGVRSRVAREVSATATQRGSHAGAGMYAYFRDVATDAGGLEWLFSPGANAGLIPTNGDQVCVFVGTDRARFLADFRGDPSSAFERLLHEASPRTARRLATATGVDRIRGFVSEPGWLRRPHGPGWALVGDAGSMKDPISAHGITDALRDAELLARALDAGLSGRASLAMALAAYESDRNRLTRPLLVAADAVASHRWTIDEVKVHHLALSAAMQQEVAHLQRLDHPAHGAMAA